MEPLLSSRKSSILAFWNFVNDPSPLEKVMLFMQEKRGFRATYVTDDLILTEGWDLQVNDSRSPESDSGG